MKSENFKITVIPYTTRSYVGMYSHIVRKCEMSFDNQKCHAVMPFYCHAVIMSNKISYQGGEIPRFTRVKLGQLCILIKNI